MREAVTRVWPLFVAIFLMMVGNGLGASLLGVRAGVEGFSGAALGVIMSMYYVGFLGGSRRTPGVLADVGHIRVFAALASVASVAVLGHILFLNEWTWGLMRLVTGFSLAGLYVTAESWLNDSSSNETRGRMLSLYMVVVMGGVATGQLALNVADIRGARLFILASAVLSLAVVPVTLASAPGPAERPVRVQRRDVFRRVPLGVVGIFGVAIAHGAMFSMGAAFAQSVGLRVRDVSLFMTAMIVGSLLATWPLGRLSDRWSRRWVIAGVSFAAAVAAMGGVVAGMRAGPLIAASFVIGALSFPLYSLLVAHTNDYVEHDEMVGVSSALVFFTGVGSILGPPVAGLLMANTVSGFFWFLAVVHAGVGAYAVYRIRKRERVPEAQRAVFVPVSPRAGSAAAYPEAADAVALAEAAGL